MTLQVQLAAEAVGIETRHERIVGTVILNDLDISPYVRDMRLRGGVNDALELELTLVNIKVNRPE